MSDVEYIGQEVRVVDIKRSFGTGERSVHVLRGVDLNVKAGEMVGLYGPSGSGKTTLLNLIGALDKPNDGDIFIGDQNITKMREGRRTRLRRTQIGFIFQNYTLIPTYTAMENIDLVLRLPGLGYFERRKRAKASLEVVGLSAWADHLPGELSGGQRQRIAIARALALRPSVILADEPTSGLDTKTSRRIMRLFQTIAERQGTAFLIVSHDPIVVDFVDQAYDLHEGKILPRLHKSELPSHANRTANNAENQTESPVLEAIQPSAD